MGGGVSMELDNNVNLTSYIEGGRQGGREGGINTHISYNND